MRRLFYEFREDFIYFFAILCEFFVYEYMVKLCLKMMCLYSLAIWTYLGADWGIQGILVFLSGFKLMIILMGLLSDIEEAEAFCETFGY